MKKVKTTIDKLAHKYALNIKQIRGPGPTKVADFKNINKNFYDDIETESIVLKDDKNLLNKIKEKTIKEFIYTNREIPNLWKNKINYQDELLNAIYKDKTLLSYIGSSSTKGKKYSYDKFPKINLRYENPKTFRSRNIVDNDNEINSIKNNSVMNSTIKNKYSFKKNKGLTEKEINTLLDDYKIAYPIKERLKELYITSNYYNSKNNKYKTISVNNSDKNEIKLNNGVNINKRASNSIDTTYSKIPRHTFMHTNKKLISKKQRTFRQNIFNNLNPSSERDNTYYSLNKDTLNKIIIKNKTGNIKKEKENDLKINVNNPIIKKNIESINFYGPYYSFCSSCRNKNMEYYNNMEPNQCIDIIHLIKKIRHKNPVMNITKNSSKKKSVQKDTLESENFINSKNEVSENEKVSDL